MKHLKKKCLSLLFLLFSFLTKNEPLLFQLSSCSRPLPPFSQGDAEKHCLALSYHAARFLLRALCVGWQGWGSGESRQGCTNTAVSCFRRAWTGALGSWWAEQWEPQAQGPGKALPSSFVIYSRSPPPLGRSCGDLQGRTGNLSINTGHQGLWPALSREARGLLHCDAFSGGGSLSFEWEGKCSV